MNYKSQIYSFTHQYFPSFSFPSSCQYILISFEKYAYTHTQNTSYTDLLFNSPNSHDSELGQFGTRCPKLNCVSHVGGILPAKRTVTCCVLGLALAGNWNVTWTPTFWNGFQWTEQCLKSGTNHSFFVLYKCYFFKMYIYIILYVYIIYIFVGLLQ